MRVWTNYDLNATYGLIKYHLNLGPELPGSEEIPDFARLSIMAW